ncbi:MAG: dihydropteroate synthase [Acidimicrobiia bacterium]|nr:MAG: dihydropteroate synthase [Acidimicrobiia bacterium]
MAPRFAVATLPRRAVMGVVNVTPDSFSDGGRYLDAGAAVDHGLALAAAGAAVLDVGGESTRPGAAPVDASEEIRRVLPVVEALAAQAGVPVSIDTAKSEVAAAALGAGASIVNDVSAGTLDPRMLDVVAEHEAGFVAMHMRGTPRTMQDGPRYDDVVREVGVHLRARVAAARAAGVPAGGVMADPGIGFGKTLDHNVALLRALPDLAATSGAPLVIGTSRKSFLGVLAGGAEPHERDDATLATTVWAFEHGVAMVRVHDVASSVRAARLLDVLDRATPTGTVAA